MSIEKVLFVEHFNEKLFRFKTTKPTNFKFKAGQFTMIGLPNRGDDTMRAYSICSAPDEDFLEFFSIKVPDGVFTTDLQRIVPGDDIEVSQRPVGSLVLENLEPGKRLWLLSTGTGIAPFISLARDYQTYRQFRDVVIVHCTRTLDEQAYAGELLDSRAVFIGTTTRDPALKRITTMVYDESLFELAHVVTQTPWTSKDDRVMLCGNEDFVSEMRSYFTTKDWKIGTKREPGHFVFEKAFVS